MLRLAGSIDTTYLESYHAVHTRDSELARDRLYSVYGANGFEPRGGNFGIRANYARLAKLGLGFCAYDAPVSVSYPEAGFVRQFFSIEGKARFATSRISGSMGAWTAIVPGEAPLRLDFGENYRQLVLRIDMAALECTMKALAADTGDRPLVFADGDPNPSTMSFLRRQVFHLADELETFADHYSPLAMAELERDLIVRFLLAHEHNFSDLLRREPRSAGRKIVDRIETYIEANWNQPIDIEDIAAIANVSARTVFREFARAGKGSPAQFARRIRLQRAAEFLRAPAAGATVTAIALRCGFQNIGRFAAEYARLHGELPSETLRRALAAR